MEIYLVSEVADTQKPWEAERKAFKCPNQAGKYFKDLLYEHGVGKKHAESFLEDGFFDDCLYCIELRSISLIERGGQ